MRTARAAPPDGGSAISAPIRESRSDAAAPGGGAGRGVRRHRKGGRRPAGCCRRGARARWQLVEVALRLGAQRLGAEDLHLGRGGGRVQQTVADLSVAGCLSARRARRRVSGRRVRACHASVVVWKCCSHLRGGGRAERPRTSASAEARLSACSRTPASGWRYSAWRESAGASQAGHTQVASLRRTSSACGSVCAADSMATPSVCVRGAAWLLGRSGVSCSHEG